MNQELQPGQSLHNGRYTVKQELGRGRFAITYLADRDDGERWVIKILDPVVVASVQPLEEQRRLEDMFWQEAVALARCGSRSPYIVKVDRPFRENGVACLPLEYMGNNTLADRLERVLPEAVALGYIGQVGEALAIVHGENLVHRDVRPANIFLVPRKDKIEAVLTDFGLAMSFDAELTRTRTREQIKGFSPIELFASGQKVGAYTDVYSLAATLYEMLTGEVPVDALTRKLQGIPLVNPRQKNPDITEQTVQAILEG
ncbi:serine/threonine protein kinase, partial [Prochlorothrix hollandica]|uniref:serine/threonine protein kinase n=1 Tax=Prochlorothrix hollandica TaxID=1223 RepID=UPI00333F288C